MRYAVNEVMFVLVNNIPYGVFLLKEKNKFAYLWSELVFKR
jgi:hypothetical protein